ncbi:MAG TPA: hypothetical protein VNM24_06565, partial [Burkholderiales bacterium]|nr:hypothetical protein [Burkholderiales bacterium]
QAQQLRDPTRPPAFVAPSGQAAAPDGQSGLVLQTVLISQQRRNATISGRLLQVGESIGGLRVVEIRESAVVLQNGGERRTLELFPAVGKRRVEESSREVQARPQ